ncbi:hypothetical protein BD289DRAFT_446235 [Coniella lustricola]|uniref:Uncharacterized protein n=1 Tax=Coniella lustricola TaxID=2025994 RepID=A0A2T2ZU45_9PEZI|nr:hypothetical protein BD289DRAFT_446235 [Coniella lustricola]
MARDVEILVHISAPSTSKDDMAYRELATAYMAFEPGKSTTHATSEPELSLGSLAAVSPDARQERRPVLPPTLDSPLASFRSVWANITSPALAAWQHCQRSSAKSNSQPSNNDQAASASTDSWLQPPSEIPDSLPYNDISLAGFTTPTRVLDYFLQTHGPVASQPSQSTAAPGPAEASTVYYDDDDDAVGDSTMLLLQGACAPGIQETSSSALPGRAAARLGSASENTRLGPEVANTSSQVLDITSDRTHVTQTPSSLLRCRRSPISSHTPRRQQEGRGEEAETTVSRLGPESHGSGFDGRNVVIPATQRIERADSAPPLAKRRRHDPGHQSGEAKAGDGPIRSASDILPRNSKQPLVSSSPPQSDLREKITNHDAAGDIIALLPKTLKGPDWSNHLELISADPPPGDNILGHKTPKFLESIFRSAQGPRRYRPRFQARNLRPYERGFWTLSLVGWSREAQRRTWHFLGNYIRRDGKAGWGTRACRDAAWTWLRLYGWEHIAGELYILLYVASERRTNSVDMIWRDGAGEVLIVVGARAGGAEQQQQQQ